MSLVLHCILRRLSRLSVGNVCHHLTIPPGLWGLPFLKNKIFRKLLLFRALQGRQMELLEHWLKWHLAHFSKSRIRIKATGPVLELLEGLSARAAKVIPVCATGSLLCCGQRSVPPPCVGSCLRPGGPAPSGTGMWRAQRRALRLHGSCLLKLPSDHKIIELLRLENMSKIIRSNCSHCQLYHHTMPVSTPAARL